MKYYLKTSILSILTLVLLLFILFVDTTFYHVPSFIKIYSFERELIIAITLLSLFYGLKSIYNRMDLDLKQTLIAISVSIFSLFLLIILPQIFFKKYLVLWDNNPFLAEYPLFWNSVSTYSALVTSAVLIFFLLLVKKLMTFRPNKFSDFEYRFLIGLLLIFAFVFNFMEDRYTFEPISLIQHGMSKSVWIFGVPLLLITLIISYYKPWLDLLNKREKYIGFGLTILIIPVSVFLISSNLMLSVYAFSTTLKGFVLSTLAFINIYAIASFLGLLFRLPTATLYDRVTSEIMSISKISKMISAKENINQVLNSIVEYACALTSSDACWLVFESEDTELSRIVASINISESERLVLDKPEACCLGNWVRDNHQPALVHNISEDERTIYLRSLKLNWKSIIAIPLSNNDVVMGILYSGKKSTYAYDNNALNTLKSFGVQINIALGNSDVSKYFRPDSILEDQEKSDTIIELKHNNLNLIVYNNEIRNQDFITISEGAVSCVISYSLGITPEKKNEFKGVLKTLFTLESDPISAYRKTTAIIMKDFPEDSGLPVYYYSDLDQELTVFCRHPLKIVEFNLTDQSIKPEQKHRKLTATADIFYCQLPVRDRVFFIVGNEQVSSLDIPSSINENLMKIADGSTIGELKKIIPEALQKNQQDSGITDLILFKKAR